jgi:Tol biopolymer transport system component
VLAECPGEWLALELASQDGANIASPRWSSDSRWIAFDSGKEGNSDIYVISADRGKMHPFTTGPSDNIRPSWSRDGRWIYFGSNRSGVWQIWKAPAQGGAALQVTKKGGREAFESFDGKFAYYTNWERLGSGRCPWRAVKKPRFSIKDARAFGP